MIFVTVGTHEQQFNRLVEYMDKWAESHGEEVVIQTGFSTYIPKKATWKKLFSYSEMKENVAKARIVVTHGGPSSFIMPLQTGKIPVVVPRRKSFGEHVNDHQFDFCKQVAKRQGNIIFVENIKELDKTLANYDEIVAGLKNGIKSNNDAFCSEFERIVQEIIA
ncbi:glycosyltransferase [Butyrivibrio sp. VCB2006]|uniref:glycosyltransferase n=1 Tax=Butyrivibrio sp. VCB2006 TaxID=1280679 RepID=UPI0004292B4C|nr:glycosyltransferase [Butyrivibrio sp. VCB2006]